MSRKPLGRPGKIDPVELARMLRDGLSQSEAARHFKVSRAAVSLAVKKLNHAKTTEVALRAAPQVIAMDLRAIEQLTKINEQTQILLNDLRGHLDGERKFRISDTTAATLLLKTIGEIRSQAKLQQDAVSTLIDFNEVQNFQRTVISILYEVCNPQQRKEIISRLQQNRLVRRSLKFDRP